MMLQVWFKNRRAKCRQQAQSNAGPNTGVTGKSSSRVTAKRPSKSPSQGDDPKEDLKLLKACSSPVTFPAPGRGAPGTPAGGSSAPSSAATPSPPLTPGYSQDMPQYYWGSSGSHTYSQPYYYPSSQDYYTHHPHQPSHPHPHPHTNHGVSHHSYPYYSHSSNYTADPHQYNQYLPASRADCSTDPYLG